MVISKISDALPNDSFGQRETGGEFAIVPGRPHDDRDAVAFDPNLQRLFRRDFIRLLRPLPTP